MLPSEFGGLPATVTKYIWNMKLLKEALGLSNEKQVREWFYNHPHVMAEFEKANREIDAHIRVLQNSAVAALQHIQASERMSAFQAIRVPMELDYIDEPVKKRKIKEN